VKKACDSCMKSKFYMIADMDKLKAQALIEKHLISPDLVENSPYGAVIINDTEDISIMLNEEDHIREQCIVSGFGLEQAYNNIVKVDKALEAEVEIAYDKDFGYLTACPTNLGAAMRASVMLFLPALTILGSINSFILKYQENGFTTRGVYGEGSEAEGFMYQVSNQAAIGQSEKEILTRMNFVIKKLIDAERIARKNLEKTRGADLKDEIMRSYGALKYAVKMSSAEFMKTLAMVKLGVCLGYVNVDIEKLNQLIVMSQPAMLCNLAGKRLNSNERDVTRMALIKKILWQEEV
ncbi:MAG: ATP--guanido phosphotransferase, partial [Clostridia bacterium]